AVRDGVQRRRLARPGRSVGLRRGELDRGLPGHDPGRARCGVAGVDALLHPRRRLRLPRPGLRHRFASGLAAGWRGSTASLTGQTDATEGVFEIGTAYML